MTEKPKRKAKNRFSNAQKLVFGLFIFLGIVFVSCFLFMVWIMSDSSHCDEEMDEEAIVCIEELLDYDLPESSKNVYFYEGLPSERWLPNTRIRFTAKADEIKIWLENPYFCFRSPLPNEQIFLPTQKDHSDILDHDWWNPYAMETFIGDRCYDINHTYPYASHLIQIDISNSEYWTVYFEFWFY